MTMSMNEIERALRDLRLSGVRATLDTRVLQAQASQQPFLETFSLILQDELDRRRSRLTERRYQTSGLDERVTLQDFDWRFNPKLPRQACFELHTLKFITDSSNALIIGKPGTGKSHIAKAVAYHATLQGYRVRYVEADSAFAQFALASSDEHGKTLEGSARADRSCSTTCPARRINDAGAELLQTVVHRRYMLRRARQTPPPGECVAPGCPPSLHWSSRWLAQRGARKRSGTGVSAPSTASQPASPCAVLPRT